MTIHMIRFRCSESADSYLIDSYIPQWLLTHTAWSQADNSPPVLTPALDTDSPYYRADWRFDWSASKLVLLSNLEQYTQSYSDWYSIGYHECDHDETDRGGCQWGDVLEWSAPGSEIPNDLPALD